MKIHQMHQRESLMNAIQQWLLRKQLDSDDWDKCLESAEKLQKSGDTEATLKLIDAVQNAKSTNGRASAIRALGIGKEGKAEALLTQILGNESEDSGIRSEAAKALARLAGRGFKSAIKGICKSSDDTGFLDDIAKLLGEARDSWAIEALICLLERKNWYAGYTGTAIRELEKLRDRRAIPSLVEAAKSSGNYPVDAARALSAIDKKTTLELMINLLENGKPFAAPFIGKIGGPRAVKVLTEQLKNEHTRAPVIEALADCGNVESAHAVRAFLVEPGEVRGAALKTICKLGTASDLAAVLSVREDTEHGTLVMGTLKALLERDAKNVGVEALRILEAMPDLKQYGEWEDVRTAFGGAYQNTVDCGALRKVAARELSRRGLSSHQK